jgi:hypothetical protein
MAHTAVRRRAFFFQPGLNHFPFQEVEITVCYKRKFERGGKKLAEQCQEMLAIEIYTMEQKSNTIKLFYLVTYYKLLDSKSSDNKVKHH